MRTKSFTWFVFLLFANACIERINFGIGDASSSKQIVVFGQITDGKGPYRVKMTRPSSVDDDLRRAFPFSADRVVISDNLGNSVELHEMELGEYETDPTSGFRGEVGRSYTLRIEARDRTVYESSPAEMLPVAEVDSVYHQFEESLPISGPTKYGFKIYMDSHANSSTNKYLRWRFTGAYQVEAFPDLNHLLCNCCRTPGPSAPLPCSAAILNGSNLNYVKDCTCCIGWVSDYEKVPMLNNEAIETGGKYEKIEVGYVPFNAWTFGHNKYMVKVEQMSLTKDAYDFWKIIKDQKDGLTSLFQPAFGKVRTNLTSSDPTREVAGIFYASSVKYKTHFLSGVDASISIPPYDISPPSDNCSLWTSVVDAFDNTSVTPPEGWN